MKAIGWYAAGQACLVADGAAVHQLGPAMRVDQLTLLRGLGTAILACFLFRKMGLQVLRSSQPLSQVIRAFMALVSLWLIFYSYSNLPLADASALNYTRPVFITLYGVLLLNERMSPLRWTAVLTCLLGALLTIGPGFNAWSPVYLVALGGAAVSAATAAGTRYLGRRDTAETTLVYIVAVSVVCSSTAIGRPLPFAQWPFLLIVLCAGALSNWFILLALQSAEVSLLAPYEYAKLPLLVLLGIVVFAEPPGVLSLAGIILIFLAGVILIIRESRQPAARPALRTG